MGLASTTPLSIIEALMIEIFFIPMGGIVAVLESRSKRSFCWAVLQRKVSVDLSGSRSLILALSRPYSGWTLS